MKLLLAHGADPKIDTTLHVTALQVAAGIGWVEGITYEWSQDQTLQAVKMLLDLGLDPNAQADTGRTALHGAAHKGRPDVVQALVDHGAKLNIRDYGNTDNRGGKLAVHTWEPVDYADGLVRVGVQSAIPHPRTGLLIRKLLIAQGLPAPPVWPDAGVDLHRARRISGQIAPPTGPSGDRPASGILPCSPRPGRCRESGDRRGVRASAPHYSAVSQKSRG